jgi:uncharacterized protein
VQIPANEKHVATMARFRRRVLAAGCGFIVMGPVVGSSDMYRSAISRNAFLMAVAALVCVCFESFTAQAQQPQAKPPTPGAIAAAREVIVLRGAGDMVDPVVRGVIESVKNSFVPTNPNLTQELNEVAVVLHKELDGKSGEVIDQMAKAYAARFTEQELKDLLAFYKTPLGLKLVKEEPAAIEEGLKGAQQWAEAFSDTVMARMRNEMQKKGHPL